MTQPLVWAGEKPLTLIFAEEGILCGRDMTIEETFRHPAFASWTMYGFTHVHLLREASRPDAEVDRRVFMVDAMYAAQKYGCECVFSEMAVLPTLDSKAVFLYFLKKPAATTAE